MRRLEPFYAASVGIVIELRLLNANREAMDLTGYTEALLYVKNHADSPFTAVIDATAHSVKYTIPTPDLFPAGEWEAQAKVSHPLPRVLYTELVKFKTLALEVAT